jgi:hypothetical protein
VAQGQGQGRSARRQRATSDNKKRQAREAEKEEEEEERGGAGWYNPQPPRSTPKKNGGPLRGGWFLGGQKSTRAGKKKPRFFYRVLNFPHQETPKNVIKKKSRKKSVLGFLSIFLLKLFDTIVLENVFCCVFELPSRRST